MDNARMEEMEKNGVADYWVALRTWVKDFWVRNYPYQFTKSNLKEIANEQIDERLALRNRALQIMSTEIEQIISEKESRLAQTTEKELLEGSVMTLSEQEHEIMKMKERIIERLYEENATPAIYQELSEKSKEQNQREGK